jgi:hypothetical protein
MKVVTPVPYEKPADGYDICESCNYLDDVFEVYALDDGSRMVPLCRECAVNL